MPRNPVPPARGIVKFTQDLNKYAEKMEYDHLSKDGHEDHDQHSWDRAERHGQRQGERPMNEQAWRATETLPPDHARHILQVCQAFEAAWSAGQRPVIEPYLRDTPPSARGVLLRELLRLDLTYRGRWNEQPSLEEYCQHFPDEGDLIRAVFREMPTAGTPQPGPFRSTSRGTEPACEPAAGWPAVPGYEILGQLAPGGMGVVYKARQVGLNRTVALKMIRTGLHAGHEERARFRVEAEAVASLSHPHIIPIYDCGEWNGMPYLAMEFAEGGSLAQRLLSRPLPPSQAAELVETLARAVQFVHEQGLIHRDLKPANILLTDQGIPKLADFGLARRLDRDQKLTGAQAILGTASYMAPEQAAGDKHALGPAADIYALGAILYELLTGQPPFRAETFELTIHQVLSEDALPPSKLRPEVAAELEAICLKCLEKEPARRFASALALAEDLHRYQNGEPISIRSEGLFEWHARSARRAGYEILDVLGAGVRGIVYKARHLALNRIVALKMIASPGHFDAARLARLRAEVEAVARLQHPHIVEICDFGEYQGEPYLAKEYVEGGSLADGLTGPMKPAEQTAALVETLARAVHHAHQQGIVHGGLKPSEVLLGADGTAKISGFGLTQVLRDELPRTGLKQAYPALSNYLAPEQAEDREEGLSPATDVYALGAILYELLSGRPPVLADTVRDTLEKLRLGKPEPPRHWRPEVPSELEAICLRCLEKEPSQRYPSAAALAEDLRRFRAGEVLFIDNLDEWTQQQRWARRAGYEIMEVFRRGPESFVYKARQVALDRMVVLKRMMARDRFVPAAKARFRREAYFLVRLRHANIVQLYDHGEQNDLPYFAREFVDGRTPAEQAAEAPLSARSAAELVKTLAQAIQAAFAHGGFHGCLNPENVRLARAGVPKITSFRRLPLPGDDSAEPRPESEIRRLAGYLAPEQLERKSRTLDAATDVYTLGVILYTLLTGQPLFPGPTLRETLDQVRSEAPTPPRCWQRDLPVELEAICLKCLEKQPSRRLPSAEALAEELGLFLGR
jgi:serine/threonine protein kinase